MHTFLSLKCSNKAFLFSIHKVQPNYVELEKNSLASIYSNWNVVTKDPHPPRLCPRDGISCYNSTHNSANHAMFNPADILSPVTEYATILSYVNKTSSRVQNLVIPQQTDSLNPPLNTRFLKKIQTQSSSPLQPFWLCTPDWTWSKHPPVNGQNDHIFCVCLPYCSCSLRFTWQHGSTMQLSLPTSTHIMVMETNIGDRKNLRKPFTNVGLHDHNVC